MSSGNLGHRPVDRARLRVCPGVVLTLGLVLMASSSPTTARGAETPVDYNRDVRPILAQSCFACHGPDDAARQGELRLDLRDAALEGGASGVEAIVPGDPEVSELIFRITEEDPTVHMPPRSAGASLEAEQVETLRRWIAQGAPYAEHWAFVPPEDRPVPEVRDRTWPRNGIDHWILARLEAEGLAPSAEADRYTLARRLSLDLRGLPPSPEEVEAYINDPNPGAYERLVDRFLADPAHGERMARIWLDLARYADSAGYGSDPLRPQVWRYRDWVIDAFNRNLPFDQFTIEQLAGDLLPSPTLEQRVATAFHRNTMTNTEGGTDDEEFRVAAVKDRAEVTMQVWMGLTMGCAQCHSHKYDPITHEDYYRFFAVFNQTADTDQPDESPTLPAPTAAQQAETRRIDARIAELQRQLDAIGSESAEASDSQTLREEIARLEKSRPEPPKLPVMQELPPDRRRVTHLLNKGNFLDPGPEVEPGVPGAFHALPAGAEANRLGVARWLVDPANPLTARVAVNRYWSLLFGIGLVETEEDFGTQGEPPSHPELLDWLALEYQRNGWDTKALLRLIVTSATYRQSSGSRNAEVGTRKLAGGIEGAGDGATVDPQGDPPPSSPVPRSDFRAPTSKDPKNRLLARAPRLRLEGEAVRDQALALSGLLSTPVGGPSVFPPQPEGLWQAAFNGQRTWTTSTGGDRYRRGLYTFWRRTVPYPSLATFDAPSRELCTLRRVSTNTPLQAFVTLNDPAFVEAAQALGRRLVAEGGTSPESRARYGLRLCLGRPPDEQQVRVLVALYRDVREHYQAHPDEALALATDPLGPLPEGLDPVEAAAWTAVANVLLNLDGVLTRG